MKTGRLLFRILALVFLTLAISPATPALAIKEPTSVSLSGIVIFEDLLVEDDFLAVVPYNITYTDEPEENISQTYIFRLMSPDGTIELGTALANPAYNGGYGSGMLSFYPSANITWGEPYIFRVQQNPTHYPLSQYWDFVIGDSNYSTASDQAAALKVKVIESATFLATVFNRQLLAKSESGATVLSTYGELYYLDAIPGLQNMCPALFEVQLEVPDFTKRTWSYTLAESLKTKYADTFIGGFMTGFAGLFEMETSMAMSFLSIALFVAIIGISVWKFKATMLSGFTDGYALLLLLMLMGFFPMVATGAIAFCMVVMGGVILFLNRA